MRARRADVQDYVKRDGVRVFYEVYGSGPVTILVLPAWSVLHSAHGRFQLVDLSRHYRIVTFDGRGNGRSDRPKGRAAYAGEEFVRDAVAVLDATGTERAVVVACSTATYWLLRLAAEHPDRVLGAVATGTNLPLAPAHERPEAGPFYEPYRSTQGGEVQRRLLAHGLRGFPAVLLLAGLDGAAFRLSHRYLHGLGSGDDAGDADRDGRDQSVD